MATARLYVVFIVTVLLSGCVVFPVTRTYFEPNPADGELDRSSSCGYNRAGKDGLTREIADLRIHMYPTYEKEKLISVTMLFRYSEGEIKLLPEQFELHGHPDGSILKPSDVSRLTYPPETNHPYHSNWIYLTFSVKSEILENIKFVFPAGAVVRNGSAVDILPFRFKKTQKSDIYYGSINC